MIYALAIFFPWLALMIKGLWIQGIFCLILQCTVIGWLPATIWAFMAINQKINQKRHEEMIDAISKNQNTQA
ncbi:YqaE/Pmp3 family membrane protein [Campylobacter sp. MIT 97-5078]|uniref:YqaE/Pmp3 family membrane protein n=1 Tax=Campylobacter sp. MIT 97-5078 TaxID=1548153 RepID=UPI00051395EA|nr:YqaE/Pmp3 family membrane protein [Campylobacter sp. MIT 97-5078]KGI55862.1 hypothetical protein LR59_10045 [Campylobacter sp. MIT 97-5078]KGI56847.1 hypothetical protein LR59_05045 [Campylobacter sp. MIT 97-5078]TQR25493.1 YqaE/Pmp3 family membrane protein [Campylobacter sp. MIT 97-5078]